MSSPPPEPKPGIRAVLVDDEASARALLREYLAAHPEVEVVAEGANGFEAVKAVAEHRPDLLLLDVQMPKLDGFEVLELLDPRPAVIFTTAYDQYAVKAFDVQAVDYLLKPFSPERLAEALARAGSRIARGEGTSPREVQGMAEARAEAGRYLERVVVRSEARIHVLPVERIDYVEAQDDLIRIKSGGETVSKPQPLGDLEKLLDPTRFVRIHRSCLLNLERLARLELYAKDSHVAILQDGTRLPVSRSGYARLKELL
jgi:two-component system LytT family response regulator